MPVVYEDPALPPEEKKKRKPPPPVVAEEQVMVAKVAAAQRASQDTMPSDLVYGIALAADNPEDVARATATIARNTDLIWPKSPPLGDLKAIRKELRTQGLVDPLTGEPPTLKRIRAYMTSENMASQIAEALVRASGEIPPARRRAAISAQPELIPVYLNIITNRLPGRIAAAEAINAAIFLADKNVDLSRFDQALATIAEWNGRTGTITETDAVGMAQWWAENNDRDMKLSEVAPLFDRDLSERARAMLDEAAAVPTLGDVAAYVYAAERAGKNARLYERYSEVVHTALADVLNREPSWIERNGRAAVQWFQDEVLGRAAAVPYLIGVLMTVGDVQMRYEIERGLPLHESGWEAVKAGIMTSLEIALLGAGAGKNVLPFGGEGKPILSFGDWYAGAAGLSPGDPGYTWTSAFGEFVVMGVYDPAIFLGNIARGWQAARVLRTGAEAELMGEGVAFTLGNLARVRGATIFQRADDFLYGTANSRWVRSLGLKGDMTNAEWIYRAALKDPEAAARIPRGAYGSLGLDPDTMAYIQKWGLIRHGGEVTAQAIEDAADIMRVAMGSRPASEAGLAFKAAIEEGSVRLLEQEVAEAVRTVVKNARANAAKGMSYVDGTTYTQLRDQMQKAVAKRLHAMGMPKAISLPILKNIRNMSLQDILELGRARVPAERIAESVGLNLRAIAGIRERIVGHVTDLAERRATLEAAIGEMDGLTAKGIARRFRAHVGEREYRELVGPLLAEGRTPSEILDVLVHHQRGGGLLGDLLSDAGLVEREGLLASVMGELRDVLGDELTTLITPGVKTTAQLRTRLRLLLEAPEDLLAEPTQRLIVRWTDGLAGLEGGQRIVPSTGGMLQTLRDYRLGIADSTFWRSKAWGWARSIYEKNPTPVFNIEAFNATEGLGRWLREMRVPKGEANKIVTEFRKIAFSTEPNRAARMEAFMTSVIEKGYRSLGIPEEGVAKIMSIVRPNYNFVSKWMSNSRKVAEFAGLDVGGDVALDTMLRNIYLLPDPHQMRIAIRRSYGQLGKVQARARELFNTDDMFSLSAEQWDTLVDEVSKGRIKWARGWEEVGILADHGRNLWVAAQLLRPGWALKVLPDENFRALVMLHDFAERAEAVGYVARFLDRVGVKPTRNIAVRFADGTEHTISLDLAGLLPHEAAAAQGVMHGTQLRSMAWRQARLAKDLEPAVAQLTKGQAGYFQTWSHMLMNRVGQSELGRDVMRYLIGDTSDGAVFTWERLRESAERSGIWRSLRQPGETLDDVLRRATDYVTLGTAGADPDLIRAALARRLTPNALKKLMKGKDLPTLPKLEIEEAVGARVPLLSRTKDNLFEWFMRLPSDSLNRNPLYKALYTRELERLLRVEAEAGRTFTRADLSALTAGTHPLARTAKEYALNRELAAMFTYVNNSRFSEAMRHIMPFVSPYQEQFSVWGRLLWENPQIAERTRLSLEFLTDSGVIRRDEDTGEWLMDSRVLAGMLTVGLLFHPIAIGQAAVALGLYEGASKVFDLPGGDWAIPVSRLNLFMSNTFTTAGGVPIPTPGFSPPFNFVVNKALEFAEGQGVNVPMNIIDYFGRYGTGLAVLPSSWHKAFAAVNPDFDKELFISTQNKMADALVLQGFALTDDQGRPIPGAAEDLQAKSAEMARNWLLMRAFSQYVSPTSPIVRIEAEEAKTRLFELIDEFGYEEGMNRIRELYPEAHDIQFLAIGYSLWSSPGPRIPTTEEAAALLASPEFSTAARRHREYAWALIPSEFRDGTFSFDAARQLQEMGFDAEPQPPAAFVGGELTENSRAYEAIRQAGWQQYYLIDQQFRAALHANGDPEEGTNGYDAVKEKYWDRPIADLQNTNLPFANDWNDKTTPFMGANIAELRKVAGMDPWNQTEFGHAVRDYFEVRDEIAKEMYRNNVSGLDTTSARELGLDTRYEDLQADLEARYGDVWGVVYRTYLAGDLAKARTRRDDILFEVASATVPDPAGAEEFASSYNRDYLIPWEKAVDKAWEQVRDANTQTDESAGYLRIAELSRRAARIERQTGINPEQVSWDSLTHHEQQEKLLRTSMKPYVFLSQFERQTILGIDTTAEQEAAFILIAEAKVAANRAIDEGKDAGEVWDAFDTWFKREILPIPGMKQQARMAHRAGLNLFNSIPKDWRKGSEGEAWDAMQRAAQGIYAAFKDAGYVASSDFRQIRVQFGQWVDEWEDYSPDFKEHLDYLRSISGDQLGDLLMPELWWVTI